jgi:putative endonuclease
MFTVYVIRSSATGKLYTGFTADLVQRLGQHNSGITKSTKNRGVWELVYQEECATRSVAMQREKYLKSGKGREELKQVISTRRASS